MSVFGRTCKEPRSALEVREKKASLLRVCDHVGYAVPETDPWPVCLMRRCIGVGTHAWQLAVNVFCTECMHFLFLSQKYI